MWTRKAGHPTCAAGVEDGEKAPQAEERRKPPEAGKGKEADSPWGLQKGMQPCDTLLLAQRDLCQIPDLQTVR